MDFRIRRGPRLISEGTALVLRAPLRERLGWSLASFVMLNALAMTVVSGNVIGSAVALVVAALAAAVCYRLLVYPRLVIKDGLVTVLNPCARASFPLAEVKKIVVDRYARRWHERGTGYTIYLERTSKGSERVYAAQTLEHSSAARLRDALDLALRASGELGDSNAARLAPRPSDQDHRGADSSGT